MKRNDIDKIYSEKVTELLNTGYSIYTSGMSGSQGEISKVLLVKDNDLKIVLLDETYVWEPGVEKIYRISIGTYKNDVPKPEARTTFWIKDFNYEEQIKLYELKNQWFITEEEYQATKDIHEARFNKWYNSIDTDKKKIVGAIPSSIMKHVNSIRGFKNIKPNDISIIKTKHQYQINCISKNKVVFSISRTL